MEKENKPTDIIDREMVDSDLEIMKSHFVKGIKAGRDLLIQKFQPTFGRRSRKYKAEVEQYQQDYGQISWVHLKERAKYLKQQTGKFF